MKKYVVEWYISEGKWHDKYADIYTKKEIKRILDEHKNSYRKWKILKVYEVVKQIDKDEFLKEVK